MCRRYAARPHVAVTNRARNSDGQRRQLLLAPVTESLEGTAVDPRRAALADDLRMTGRDVADVRREAIVREERVHPPHDAVTRDLRDDRRGRDRRALLVP